MNPKALDDLRAHAVAVYPLESCGLIVTTSAGDEYFPCHNRAARPGEHFQMEPRDYANAEDAGTITTIVHSHPDAAPTPSEGDRVACEASGLPWLIVATYTDDDGNVVAGDLAELAPSGYEAPYEGRQFCHGILDCWSLVRDWYRREWGVVLPNPPRLDEWWNDGASNLYSDDALNDAQFVRVDIAAAERGDVLLMQVRSKNLVANHAGVYLGNGQFLHHLHGRLSRVDVFGGYWLECLRGCWRYTGKRTEPTP